MSSSVVTHVTQAWHRPLAPLRFEYFATPQLISLLSNMAVARSRIWDLAKVRPPEWFAGYANNNRSNVASFRQLSTPTVYERVTRSYAKD